MADERELVTVFRSAETDAETEADQIQTLLADAGLRCAVFDDSDPGVVSGSWEVRVPVEEAARAEEVLAAEVPGKLAADPSLKFDMEPVYSSTGTLAEMQAGAIQGMLGANGIQAIVVGDTVLPQLGFEVRVARDQAEEAQRLIEQAETAEPEAEEADAVTPEA